MAADIDDEINKLLDDPELRVQLKKKAKLYGGIGVVVSTISIVIAIVLLIQYKPVYVAYAVGFLFTGIAIRCYARALATRAVDPRTALSKRDLKKYKKEQEQVVHEFFQIHKDKAEKVLQMDELAKKGKYKDAYNIARSLLNQEPPAPVKIFLLNKQKQYLFHIKGSTGN